MQPRDTEWFVGRLRDLGKSQADLGRYMEVDRAIVTRLLAGDQKITVDHVEKLCLFLDAPPTQVLRACGVDFGERNRKWLADALAFADSREKRVTVEEVGGGDWSLPETIQREVGFDEKSSKIIRVDDDNMSPTFRPGDRVMIDTSATSPRPGVFALLHDGATTLRRLDPKIGSDRVRVVSDADEAGAYELKSKDLKIMGRVVWHSGRF